VELKKLSKITKRKKKRVGRGYGSGKGGHTSGRGAKGTKARSKVPLTFEGTKIKKSFIQKLPLRRGKGRFKSLKKGPVVVNVRLLNLLPKESQVDIPALVKKGLVEEAEAKKFGVKILGDGELKLALTVKLPCSKGAAEKIVKAGGKVMKVVKEEPKREAEKLPERKPKRGAKKTVKSQKTRAKVKKVKPKRKA